MQKELESGNLYVVLVSLKCLKNWGFVPTKHNFFLCDSFSKTHMYVKLPYMKQALILIQVLLIIILILIQVLVTHMQTGVRRR